MKASDSVNSLTELNPAESSDKCCFICLSEDLEQGEPLVDSKLLRNCGCKFSVHPACWNAWMKGKSDFDCPICHKSSIKKDGVLPNPVLAYSYDEQQPRRICTLRTFSLLVLTVFGTMILVAILEFS